MEQLIVQSREIVQNVKIDFKRYLYNEIIWSDRLIGILGARGTGKTTLLLQRLKNTDTHGKTSIYITLDDLYFTVNSLAETLRNLKNHGFTNFYIDEVHQYKGWAREIKNIYDLMPEVKVVFTGSSILDVQKGGTDLSRRAPIYELRGLSFREFINFKEGAALTKIDIEDVFADHEKLSDQIVSQVKPLPYWHEYLKRGYYPYVFENPETYYHRLQRVINTVLESDLRFLRNVSVANTEKMKRLLYITAGSVPFKPNISKLSERTGLHRNTLVEYLHYLKEARLLNLLSAQGKSTSTLTKPDKLYLENTNIAYALSNGTPNSGNLRETFFLNQVGYASRLRLPKKGDFIIDEKFTVEVGGSNKGKAQIKNIPNAYIAADGIERGVLNKIPLWLFGFLY